MDFLGNEDTGQGGSEAPITPSAQLKWQNTCYKTDKKVLECLGVNALEKVPPYNGVDHCYRDSTPIRSSFYQGERESGNSVDLVIFALVLALGMYYIPTCGSSQH